MIIDKQAHRVADVGERDAAEVERRAADVKVGELRRGLDQPNADAAFGAEKGLVKAPIRNGKTVAAV
jgi:hypothetical protein